MGLRFANTGSSVGGDGTTASTVGANRAYVSLAAAIAAMPSPLTEDWSIECSAFGSAADTAAVNLTGKDLAGFTLRIYPTDPARAGTEWDATKYRLTPTVAFNGAIITVAGNVIIDGLQIQNLAAIGDFPEGVRLVAGSGTQTVENCFIRHTGNTGGAGIQGFAVGTDFTLRARNNIVQGYGAGIHHYAYTTTGRWLAYNNTCVSQGNEGIGLIEHDRLNFQYVKNNLVQGAPALGCYRGVLGANLENNVSEDATSPNVAYRNRVVVFADEPGGDFALDLSDAAAYNQGVSLEFDALWPFVTDIIGTMRIGLWDIGAAEIVTPTGRLAPRITLVGRAARRVAREIARRPALRFALGALRGVPVPESVQLYAAGRDSFGGLVLAPRGTWASSDENIVRVNNRGLITPAGVGTATVTYTKNNIVGSIEITVTV